MNSIYQDKNTPFEDLVEVIGNEKCVGVVLGEESWNMRDENDNPMFPDLPIGRLISLEDAKKYLSYKYDTGFGSAELPALYAWTETRIILISLYDGATSFVSVPRNPIACNPKMVGGG